MRSPDAPGRARGADGPPLVGRDDLLDRLTTITGDGTSVVLRGPAGVGKTRLAAELCRRRAFAARAIDRVLASPGTASLRLGTLASLAPAGGLPSDDVTSLIAWFTRRWRERAAADGSAVVWLDDAQHCDPLSAAVLRQGVATGVVQMVATHRTPHPLDGALTALVVEGAARSVDVEPLDPSSAATLARLCARAPLSDADVDRLQRRARGRPLFIRALAVAGGRDGAGPLVDVVVGGEVVALPPSLRRTLELIAAGEPVPVALLASKREDLDVLRARGLVVVEDDAVRLDHPLRTEWVIASLGSLRPAALAELVDLARDADVIDHVDLVRYVDWQVQAGRTPQAALVEPAVRQAIARRDGATALRLLDAAADDDDLLRGQAFLVDGQADAGLAALTRASDDGPSRRVEAAFWHARYVGLTMGDTARAHEVLRQAQRPDLDRRHRQWLAAGHVWLWLFGPIGDVELLRSFEELVDDDPADPTAFELAHSYVACRYVVDGAQSARRAAMAVRTRLARGDLPPVVSARAGVAVAGWLLATGRIDLAVDELLGLHAAALERGDTESQVLAAGNLSLYAAVAGRITEAVSVVPPLLRVPAEPDWFHFRRLAVAAAAGAVALHDEPRRAEGLLTYPHAAEGSPPDLDVALRCRGRELLRQVQGRPADEADLLEGLAALASNRKRMWAAVIGSEVTSLEHGDRVHRLLLDSGAPVDGDGTIATVADLARARLDGDADALAAVAGRLEGMGLRAAAMRAAADAIRVAGPASRPGHISRCTALRLRRGWDGGPCWWLDGVDGLPTARQMEVAWRVVEGASVAEVAATLTVSHRTVENHLHRVYRLLGVSGREELGALLRRPDQRPADGSG